LLPENNRNHQGSNTTAGRQYTKQLTLKQEKRNDNVSSFEANHQTFKEEHQKIDDDNVLLKDENMLAVGMISLALGILIGKFLNVDVGFPVTSFLEGFLIGLSLVMNLAYLCRRRTRTKPF
jgi:uncharacterized membrane-anchored protein